MTSRAGLWTVCAAIAPWPLPRSDDSCLWADINTHLVYTVSSIFARTCPVNSTTDPSLLQSAYRRACCCKALIQDGPIHENRYQFSHAPNSSLGVDSGACQLLIVHARRRSGDGTLQIRTRGSVKKFKLGRVSNDDENKRLGRSSRCGTTRPGASDMRRWKGVIFGCWLAKNGPLMGLGALRKIPLLLPGRVVVLTVTSNTNPTATLVQLVSPLVRESDGTVRMEEGPEGFGP